MQYTHQSFWSKWPARSYVFYQCKNIEIPTCTQHLLTRSVRRPDDDRLKRSKHVTSYTINSCAWRMLINVLVYSQHIVMPSITQGRCICSQKARCRIKLELHTYRRLFLSTNYFPKMIICFAWNWEKMIFSILGDVSLSHSVLLPTVILSREFGYFSWGFH